MSRLEVIHLRTSEGSFASLAKEIREAIEAEADGAGVVTIYRRHGLETDMAIHIPHRGGARPEGAGALGLHLASALRAYGLVEHTMWEEIP